MRVIYRTATYGLLDDAASQLAICLMADDKMIRINFPEVRHCLNTEGIGNGASGAENATFWWVGRVREFIVEKNPDPLSL